MGLTRRAAAKLVIAAALFCMKLMPPAPVAAFGRSFLRRAVKKGEGRLGRMGAARRIACEMSVPLTTVALEVEGKTVELRLVAWAAWFRSSFYRTAMTRDELMLILRRFSKKVNLRVRLPSGLSLPLGFGPGILVDATGSVLEWLLDRIW